MSLFLLYCFCTDLSFLSFLLFALFVLVASFLSLFCSLFLAYLYLSYSFESLFCITFSFCRYPLLVTYLLSYCLLSLIPSSLYCLFSFIVASSLFALSVSLSSSLLSLAFAIIFTSYFRHLSSVTCYNVFLLCISLSPSLGSCLLICQYIRFYFIDLISAVFLIFSAFFPPFLQPSHVPFCCYSLSCFSIILVVVLLFSCLLCRQVCCFLLFTIIFPLLPLPYSALFFSFLLFVPFLPLLSLTLAFSSLLLFCCFSFPSLFSAFHCCFLVTLLFSHSFSFLLSTLSALLILSFYVCLLPLFCFLRKFCCVTTYYIAFFRLSSTCFLQHQLLCLFSYVGFSLFCQPFILASFHLMALTVSLLLVFISFSFPLSYYCFLFTVAPIALLTVTVALWCSRCYLLFQSTY